jgi:zeaxanthin glucosyltransferase
MCDVLILADLEVGHILSTIKMATNLQKRGLKVCYLTIPDAKPLIESHGLTAYACFEEFYPLGKVAQMRKTENSATHYLRDPGRFYLSFISGRLDEVMDKLNPKVILVGRFLALEALLLHYKYGIPQIIYHTLLPPNALDLTLADVAAGICLDDFTGLSGDAPEEILSFMLGKGAALNSLQDLVNPLRDMPQFMLCPKDFRLSGKRVGLRDIYLGPCIRETAPVVQGTINYFPDDNRKLLFASMGSQTVAYPERAEKFFKIVLECIALDRMRDFSLILSVGSEENVVNLGSVPENVSVFAWVPQTEILKRADIMITHGGLGSIKECIYSAVPMVVVPMGRDQFDNADIVSSKNIGIKRELESLNKNDLADSILQITHSTGMLESVRAMSKIFHDTEKRKPEVGFIENLISITSQSEGDQAALADRV